MANSVYQINKGINRSIEFKGLRAQYIWYLGAGVLILLVVYATLYILQVPSVLCIIIIAVAGSGLMAKVYGLSNKYGEHGMMKALAKRSVPKLIKCNSRKVFRFNKEQADATAK